MPYRDQFAECFQCKVPLKGFEVMGLTYRQCPDCRGAWVSSTALKAMVRFMNESAQPVFVDGPKSSRQCFECHKAMPSAALRVSIDRTPPTISEVIRLSLSVLAPDGTLRGYSPEGLVIQIGSARGAHVRLDSPLVAKKHASIVAGWNEWLLVPGSGATQIQGKPVIWEAGTKVDIGDEITVGPYLITVVAEDKRAVSVGNAEVFANFSVEVEVCHAHGIWFDLNELQQALAAASAPGSN